MLARKAGVKATDKILKDPVIFLKVIISIKNNGNIKIMVVEFRSKFYFKSVTIGY